MPILTASSSGAQPDYVALAMVLALAIIIVVMAIRKRMTSKPKDMDQPAAAAPEESPSKLTAPGSAGQLKLHNVDPKTAAMLMAIVANKMEKPLNELRFISIKEVQSYEI